MAKKTFIIDQVQDFEEERECDNCGNMPAADFGGQCLCNQCAHNDVFETMLENYD